LKLIVPELTTRRATSDIKVYSFDKIYDGTSSQSDIYKTVSGTTTTIIIIIIIINFFIIF